jgi:predicted ATPase
MITRVEAKQYRCLQSVRQEVGPLQVLVGPNGSGKSVFLDVISFLSTFMSSGLYKAVEDRSLNFHDLVWRRDGSCFELAIEAAAPVSKDKKIIRYELGVRLDPFQDTLVIDKEAVTLWDGGERQTVVSRDSTSCSFRTETPEHMEAHSEIRGTSSVLGNVDDRFPATVWLRELLQLWTQTVILNNEALRNPSPPGQHSAKTFDGSTLARLVWQLQEHSQRAFARWVAHVRTALPDLDAIRSIPVPRIKPAISCLDTRTELRHRRGFCPTAHFAFLH